MKIACLLLTVFAFTLPALAQKTNDTIAKQIRSLKADKSISLTSDANSSKIMGTAESFDQKESSKAGIQAMNFGMAVFYAGKSISAAPDPIALTFWVMTKKPRFATDNKWTANVGKDTLDLGSPVYAAKGGSNMEYLNFKISRANLAKIAGGTAVKFKLGSAEFTFTPSQLALFRNFLAVTDVR
jgi:hypothetical protein